MAPIQKTLAILPCPMASFPDLPRLLSRYTETTEFELRHLGLVHLRLASF